MSEKHARLSNGKQKLPNPCETPRKAKRKLEAEPQEDSKSTKRCKYSDSDDDIQVNLNHKLAIELKIGSRWSHEDHIQLIQLSKTGESKENIAKILGRTVSAIEMRLEAVDNGDLTAHDTSETVIEHSGDKWTSKEHRELLQMRGSGMSIPEMAKAFNRTGTSIKQRLEAVDNGDLTDHDTSPQVISKSGTYWSYVDHDLMISMYQRGCNIYEIGNILLVDVKEYFQVVVVIVSE